MNISWRPEKKLTPFDREEMGKITIDCFHCHRPTYLITKSVGDAEAREWKKRYERLLGSLNEAVKICRKKYGTDPMSREMMESLIRIRDDLERGY